MSLCKVVILKKTHLGSQWYHSVISVNAKKDAAADVKQIYKL